MRLAWFLLFFAACTETAPRLQSVVAPVTVLGPLCADRCVRPSELCAPFDLAACVANCDEACLLAAGDECIAARRCGRAAPTRPFASGPYGTAVKDLAGPVTIPTSEGDWAFDKEWTGDDSYVFLAHSS